MNYTPDEFLELQETIEDQGGALQPDPCLPQDINRTNPPYKKHLHEKEVTTGCGHVARFVHEYDAGGGRSHFFTACAVCDNTGLWPRYKS